MAKQLCSGRMDFMMCTMCGIMCFAMPETALPPSL